MVAPTVKNGKTRLYLTEGTANPNGILAANASEFWRTDNANQPAATLLASQAAGTRSRRQREPVPGHLQQLAAADLANDVQPILRDGRLLHRSVLVRQRGLHAGGHARHGLRDRLDTLYGELPCNTKGVGCGNGRSNGRGVLYSDTAGDPEPRTTTAPSPT